MNSDETIDITKAPTYPNAFGGHDTDEQQPLRSAAGWYIGTLYYDVELRGYFPNSRDSTHYYSTRDLALKAMRSKRFLLDII